MDTFNLAPSNHGFIWLIIFVFLIFPPYSCLHNRWTIRIRGYSTVTTWGFQYCIRRLIAHSCKFKAQDWWLEISNRLEILGVLIGQVPKVFEHLIPDSLGSILGMIRRLIGYWNGPKGWFQYRYVFLAVYRFVLWGIRLSNTHLISMMVFPIMVRKDLHINSLWPSDAKNHQRSWSTLVQLMACCLKAPSHYLNQCWHTINEILWHSFKGNIYLTKYSRYWSPTLQLYSIFIHWNSQPHLPGDDELNLGPNSI